MTEPNEFSDLFALKDRILMAAWMLPNEGPLTEAQRAQAMENFRRYLKEKGISIDDVAHELGSPRHTTIQDLIDGVYRRNADGHIRKLNMWIEQHARRQAASLSDRFVTTGVAKAIFDVAQLVAENGTMGLILGSTGIGKSRCLEALHQKYVGSILIRIAKDYRSPSGLVRALAGPLGVRDSRVCLRLGQHESQFERVIGILRGSNRLILIDEAQKLSDDALETLRDIYDSTGVPILLSATKDLHERIQRSLRPDQGQLYSRFDVVRDVIQGRDEFAGGKRLFTLQEIKELYNVLPIRLAADAAHYLLAIANHLGHGSLRRCKILLRNAARRARKRQNRGADAPVTVTADDLAYVEARLRKEAREQEIVHDRRTYLTTVAATKASG